MLLKSAKVGHQISLKSAKIVGLKDKSFRRFRNSYASNYKGVMVEDPVHGKVYFGCSSEWVWKADRGDLINAIVTVTGSGQDLVFAKRATKVVHTSNQPVQPVQPKPEEKPINPVGGPYTVIGCCGLPMSFDKDGMSL